MSWPLLRQMFCLFLSLLRFFSRQSFQFFLPQFRHSFGLPTGWCFLIFFVHFSMPLRKCSWKCTTKENLVYKFYKFGLTSVWTGSLTACIHDRNTTITNDHNVCFYLHLQRVAFFGNRKLKSTETGLFLFNLKLKLMK